jgi:integrase/recombinase XerD
VHVAQDMSGDISMKEIFRYTKPSQEEKDQLAENMF